MKTRLRLGALLHMAISIGHLACLFFLEKALTAYQKQTAPNPFRRQDKTQQLLD